MLNLVFMEYWGPAGIALWTLVAYIYSLLYLPIYSLELLGRAPAMSEAAIVSASRTTRRKCYLQDGVCPEG